MQKFKSFINEVKTEKVNGLTVFVNPSSKDIIKQFEKVSEDLIRGFYTPTDDHVYTWDGFEAVHAEIIKSLGYRNMEGTIFFRIGDLGYKYKGIFEVMGNSTDYNASKRIEPEDAASRSHMIARAIRDLPGVGK